MDQYFLARAPQSDKQSLAKTHRYVTIYCSHTLTPCVLSPEDYAVKMAFNREKTLFQPNFTTLAITLKSNPHHAGDNRFTGQYLAVAGDGPALGANEVSFLQRPRGPRRNMNTRLSQTAQWGGHILRRLG